MVSACPKSAIVAEAALSEKGIEVDLMKTDVFVIDCYASNEQGQKEWVVNKGGKRTTMIENQLYPIPDSFEVKIETKMLSTREIVYMYLQLQYHKKYKIAHDLKLIDEAFYIDLTQHINSESGDDDVPLKFYWWLNKAVYKAKTKYKITRIK